MHRACVECGRPFGPTRKGQARCPQHETLHRERRNRTAYAKRKAKSGRSGSTRRWRDLRAAILARNPVCAYCKRAQATELDHRIPVARGGAMYDMANLVPSCRACNRKKGANAPSSSSAPTSAGEIGFGG